MSLLNQSFLCFFSDSSKKPSILEIVLRRCLTVDNLINHLNIEGLSPLHLAVDAHSPECVESLINDARCDGSVKVKDM